MDGRQFDQFAKSLATGVSRRSLFRVFAGGMAAALAPGKTKRQVFAAKTKETCFGEPAPVLTCGVGDYFPSATCDGRLYDPTVECCIAKTSVLGVRSYEPVCRNPIPSTLGPIDQLCPDRVPDPRNDIPRDDCTCSYVPDGTLDRLAQKDFKDSCLRHDHCYTKCGKTKEECDEALLADMLGVCDALYSKKNKVLEHATCVKQANSYHYGLTEELHIRTIALFFYDRSQRQSCACCGAGIVCPEGLIQTEQGCVRVCPQDLTSCNGTCVDVYSDPNNCGGCGTTCESGECFNGFCTESICPQGQTFCDHQCVDTNRHYAHCGSCDNPCDQGKLCCNGTCTFVGEDPNNCGDCGVVCADSEICVHSVGSCCPVGTENACNGPGGECCREGQVCQYDRCCGLPNYACQSTSECCVDMICDSSRCCIGPDSVYSMCFADSDCCDGYRCRTQAGPGQGDCIPI